MENVIDKDRNRIFDVKNFLHQKSIYKNLTSLGAFISKRKPMDLEIKIGGRSYTDEEIIRVGVPREFINDKFEIIYTVTQTLYLHELQHTLSSNLNDLSTYVDEETTILRQLGFPNHFAINLVHSIGNIIEDGRIENILGNNMPGSVSKLQYLRLHYWNLSEIDENVNEFNALMSTILQLAVLGIYPKNYGKFYKDTELDKEIDKIKDLIFEGVAARTCKEGLNKCREILKILQPYLLKLFDNLIKQNEEFQRLTDLIEKLAESSSYTSSEESQTNDSNKIVVHILIEKSDGNEEKKNKKGENNTIAKCSNKDEDDKKESNKSKANGKSTVGDDESDDDNSNSKDNDTNSNDNNEENDNKDNKEGDNIDNKDNKDNTNNKDNKDTDKNNDSIDNSDNDDSDNDNKNDNKNNNDTSLSKGADPDLDDQEISEGYSDEELARRMEDISKGLEEEGHEDLNRIQKSEVFDKKIKEEKNKNSTSLTSEEIAKIDKDLMFTEYPNDFSLNHELPPDLKISSKRFKKEIENIFKNKETLSVNGQEKGVLNPNDLFRVRMKDYNIFSVEGAKSTSDYCAYILQDGSGSMSGDKEMFSTYALSTIEEGLKGIIPFKLVTFSASHGVEHYLMKDWKDKSKMNYSYNFSHYRMASGYNEDGYSIRVTTQELLKRPEKDKILIVLSDGLPHSIDDAKLAIKEARAKGIFLVGIMFGPRSFRESNIERYRDMYEKNIIAVEPKAIPNKLTQLLKKILIR